MNKIVKISLAGVLLFSVIFMNVSNKNISGSNYFLEKEKFLGKKNKKENKKDDSIGVECKDFDAKNKLENSLFKKSPKKQDNVNNKVNFVGNFEKNDKSRFRSSETYGLFTTCVPEYDYEYCHIDDFTCEESMRQLFDDFIRDLEKLFTLIGIIVTAIAVVNFVIMAYLDYPNDGGDVQNVLEQQHGYGVEEQPYARLRTEDNENN